MELGTAYQIYDDCLDIFGSESAVGKSLGTDFLSGKLTLPALLVLERATDAGPRASAGLCGDPGADKFETFFELLQRYDALNESRTVINEHLDHARQWAGGLPPSESLNALLVLTDFIAQQTEAIGV